MNKKPHSFLHTHFILTTLPTTDLQKEEIILSKMSICLQSLVLKKLICFVSEEVTYPAKSDRGSQVAGNGAE